MDHNFKKIKIKKKHCSKCIVLVFKELNHKNPTDLVCCGVFNGGVSWHLVGSSHSIHDQGSSLDCFGQIKLYLWGNPLKWPHRKPDTSPVINFKCAPMLSVNLLCNVCCLCVFSFKVLLFSHKMVSFRSSLKRAKRSKKQVFEQRFTCTHYGHECYDFQTPSVLFEPFVFQGRLIIKHKLFKRS